MWFYFLFVAKPSYCILHNLIIIHVYFTKHDKYDIFFFFISLKTHSFLIHNYCSEQIPHFIGSLRIVLFPQVLLLILVALVTVPGAGIHTEGPPVNACSYLVHSQVTQ